MARYLCYTGNMKSLLCITLFIFALQLQAQTKLKTDTLRSEGVIYAIKVNGFIWQLPRYATNTITAYGVDYSFYVQCDRTGLFMGYTPLYLVTKNMGDPIKLNALNFGLQYRITPLNKMHALYLCLYDLRNSQYSKNILPYKSNLICFNPRYRLTFWKRLLSLKVGLTAGFSIDRNLATSSARTTFNLNSHYGCNVGLAFNFSALINKGKVK